MNTGAGIATSTYGYDYQNNRVAQYAGGITTIYVNKLYSTNSASTTKHIFAGNDLIAVVERTTATTTHIVHTDHLGGTNAITDADGDIVQALDYYPYGDRRINSGTDVSKREYIGEMYDAESGLNYLNARYYQSSRGQFLSQDPVFWENGQTDTGKFVLTNPQLLNSYSYAADNPIVGKDADGKLVELISRPVGGMGGYFGAHSFVAVIPENPKTIGSIAGIETSRPFTLGGYTTGVGDLFKNANADSDYAYAYGSRRDANGVAQVIVDPPSGVSAEKFDQQVLRSYNALPSVISNSYGFMGQNRLTGNPNSNNVATEILLGAGVTSGQVNSYQHSLYAQNLPRITPGLGTSVSGPTYGQSINNQLNATLNSLKSVLSKLQAIVSKLGK